MHQGGSRNPNPNPNPSPNPSPSPSPSPRPDPNQVWLAHRFVREQRLPPLVNVVFMGMGEPLNNLAAVSVAVRLLTHPQATRTLN